MYSKFVFSQDEEQLWFITGEFFASDGNAILGYYNISNGGEQYYDMNSRTIFFIYNELFFLNDFTLVMTSLDDYSEDGFFPISYVINVTDLFDDD